MSWNRRCGGHRFLDDPSGATLICCNETLISNIVRGILHALSNFIAAVVRYILLITEFVPSVLIRFLSDAISSCFYNQLASS